MASAYCAVFYFSPRVCQDCQLAFLIAIVNAFHQLLVWLVFKNCVICRTVETYCRAAIGHILNVRVIC